jgi:hypothetical protein
MQSSVLGSKYPIMEKIVTEGKIIEEVGDFNVLALITHVLLTKKWRTNYKF